MSTRSQWMRLRFAVVRLIAGVARREVNRELQFGSRRDQTAQQRWIGQIDCLDQQVLPRLQAAAMIEQSIRKSGNTRVVHEDVSRGSWSEMVCCGRHSAPRTHRDGKPIRDGRQPGRRTHGPRRGSRPRATLRRAASVLRFTQKKAVTSRRTAKIGSNRSRNKAVSG